MPAQTINPFPLHHSNLRDRADETYINQMKRLLPGRAGTKTAVLARLRSVPARKGML